MKNTFLAFASSIEQRNAFMVGLLLLVLIFSLDLHAQKRGSTEPALSTMLSSAAYGAGAGALVGTASLAFAPDPAANMNNIARGASLGLYAGVLWGAYQIWAPPSPSASTRMGNRWMPLVIPTGEGRIDGLAMVMPPLNF